MPKLILFLLFSALLSGCLAPRQANVATFQNDASAHYINGVPFIRQQRFFCGPAAIAVVEQFNGRDVDQSEIAEQVFAKSIKATLTLDFHLYAKEQNLWSQQVKTLDAIKAWIRQGVPVIALMQVGPPIVRQHHFIVMIGFDDSRGQFITHDAYLANRIISYRKFTKQWSRARHWALVMAPPDHVTWPLDAAGYNDLGVRFEAMNNNKQALAVYEKAIKAEPAKAVYHFNRANVLFKMTSSTGLSQDSLAPVIAGFQKALSLDADFVHARNNLAYASMLAGDLDAALTEALAVTGIQRKGVERFEYWETLAEIREARKERMEAITAWKHAMSCLKESDPRRSKIAARIKDLESQRHL
ncbi:MAG: C39 family peptidase [Planctomycetota bacterium]|nr:C39 family peptidase [Planctomycetota bacterium]